VISRDNVANSGNAEMPIPNQAACAMRTRSQFHTPARVETMCHALQRVTEGEEIVQGPYARQWAYRETKPDGSRQSGFERHFFLDEAGGITALLRGVSTGLAMGRVNRSELGEPCDGNPEPSIESEEIALIRTDLRACVETRCCALPCGHLGDEGIVLPTVNSETVDHETNGASDALRHLHFHAVTAEATA
jgi:hypothetical protein